MTSAQHTPGPWTALLFAPDAEYMSVGVQDADGNIIAQALNPRIAHEDTFLAEMESNARLIAAAPETATERDGLKMQIETMQHIASHRENQFAETRAERDKLRQINAELLAALKAVVAIADRKTDEFDRARAAIAKAEGKSHA